MNKTTLIFLSVFGLICFAAGFSVSKIFSPDKPQPVAVTKEVKESYAVGVPDTSTQVKRQKIKVKIKKVEDGYVAQSNNDDWGIKNVKVFPPVDKAEIDVDAEVKEKIITRVDTVHVTETIVEKEYEKEKESNWSLAVGSMHTFIKEFEPIKYAVLQYQHKIWFFYLGGKMGVQNKFNEGLNNLQMAANIELSVPLN